MEDAPVVVTEHVMNLLERIVRAVPRIVARAHQPAVMVYAVLKRIVRTVPRIVARALLNAETEYVNRVKIA